MSYICYRYNIASLYLLDPRKSRRMTLDQLISKVISKSLNTNSNTFDLLMQEMQSMIEAPAHSISDLKRQVSTKIKGDLWEEFCVLYLLKIKGFDLAWRLKDVPSSVREVLSLGTKDIGIDIVAQKGSLYYAVQCKYKKNSGIGYKGKGNVGWKELSTFYALCARTGPWEKHIVMTNCNYVSHMGTKSEKDWSICKKSFEGIHIDQWRNMIGAVGNKLDTATTISTPSIEQLRDARLKYLERFNNQV